MKISNKLFNGLDTDRCTCSEVIINFDKSFVYNSKVQYPFMAYLELHYKRTLLGLTKTLAIKDLKA